jgi:uncharacterized membrane protein SpoIIM required for sporulation
MTAGLRSAPGREPAAATVLQRALARPSGRDTWGIAACTGYQVGLIVVAAVAIDPAGTVRSEPPSSSVVELFLHNAAVYGLWLAGALTLGVVPLALATTSSVVSGATVGAAVSLHGATTLGFLGHAVFELPALAIAFWLAVRPVLDLWAARRRADDGGATLPELVRSWIPLTALALLLLGAAAVWESTVLPTW